MKKLLISSAFIALTSTAALANPPSMGSSYNYNFAPITNSTTQNSTANGMLSVSSSVTGGTGGINICNPTTGSTTSAQSVTQSVTSTNINGTAIFSGINFQ